MLWESSTFSTVALMPRASTASLVTRSRVTQLRQPGPRTLMITLVFPSGSGSSPLPRPSQQQDVFWAVASAARGASLPTAGPQQGPSLRALVSGLASAFASEPQQPLAIIGCIAGAVIVEPDPPQQFSMGTLHSSNRRLT